MGNVNSPYCIKQTIQILLKQDIIATENRRMKIKYSSPYQNKHTNKLTLRKKRELGNGGLVGSRSGDQSHVVFIYSHHKASGTLAFVYILKTE